MDFAIIGVLAVAVALLASGYFVRRNAPVAIANAAQAIPAKSIAVLPFENLSDDKKNEYFVEGMQDLILTKLANIGSLKVISRTSTEKYKSRPDNLKQVAAELGVATILEGSVQKAGNQVLINVQLIDANSDSHIWAQSYTRTLDNVFNVEGDVAGKIADALNAKLSSAETARLASDLSSNNAANDLFLQAEYQANQGVTNYGAASFKSAIPLYRQAIAQAPTFALAYARLSHVQSELAWFGGDGMNVKQLNTDARSNAEQALKLAPNLPAAHLALGYSDYYGRSDYDGALKAFAVALALRPNDPDALTAQGYVERFQGRFDAALVSLQRAFALDPRKSERAFELGSTYMMMARYPDAEHWFRRALALDPHNLHARELLSLTIMFATGDIPGALAEMQGDDATMKLMRTGLLTTQRKYQEALTLLDSVPKESGDSAGGDAMDRAELYRLMGDMARARPLYAEALPKLRAQVKNQQGFYNQALAWNDVAAAELGLGHIPQGLATIAKSQVIGGKGHGLYHGNLKEANASLYAEARRPDLAVPLLTQALASPGIGRWYSPAMLWLDPDWDPIRHDPRFQALLKQYAKYKPAVTYDTP
ncbi:MAG TPA: tetratricopeptide repeat protein [Rhodanobacter sp.]|jgi:TolB-like protein|nr:tetratricopeptide repeat protein [Rhodanobacter sp.]